MKRAWISEDPESGCYHDEFGGTHRYKDGKTLAEEFPNLYFQVPVWVAWILDLAAWLHTQARGLAYRYKTEKP